MEFVQRSIGEFKSLLKVNPLLGPLSFVGASYVLYNLWSGLKFLKDNLNKTNLDSLKEKYQGEWAFVADVSKPLGKLYASILAKCGYHIICLNGGEGPLRDEIESLGRNLETIVVSPFCSPLDPADADTLKDTLAGKAIGIVIMNLFYESPCHFESEPPMALMGSINACVIKTTIYTQILLEHVEKQPTRSALVTIGSILGGSGWPGFQVSSGCAAYIEKFTELAKEAIIETDKVDILHLKRGYVPRPIRDSSYAVEERVEAEQGLRKIGVCEKAAAHYRIMLQDWLHNSKTGKANKFAYSKIGVLQRCLR